MDQVVNLLKGKAETAFSNVIQYLNRQYTDYCGKAGLVFKPLEWEPRVITYEELYNEVRERLGGRLDVRIKSLVDDLLSRGTDTRVVCLRVVEEVRKLSLDTRPVVVLFFAPPYCPHNTVKGETAAERELLEIIREVAGVVTSATGETPENMHVVAGLLGAKYGCSLSFDDLVGMAEQLIADETEFNRRAGIPSTANDLPDFFRHEKIGPGNLCFDVPRERLERLFNKEF